MTEQTAESEILPVPQKGDLEPIPKIRAIEVVARIKKTSKYSYQGLEDRTNPRSKQRFFKLTSITPLSALTKFDTKTGREFENPLALRRDAYCLHFNGNTYRIEDCELFLRDANNPKLFTRIL